ncbi:MAG: ADOP family duplicated permease [Vicinamibacteraceae bacterium]
MSSLFQDARFAIRNLRKSPGLVAAAVFSLAIGIGATTTVYSAIDALRSQELPFAAPERLVVLWQSSGGGLGVPSYQVAAEVARKAAAVESLGFALGGGRAVTLSEVGEPARAVPAEVIDLGALRMLGTAPVLGRLYAPEDRRDVVLQKESRSIVIGYRLWQERFGGSPKALGQTLRIGGYDRPVIGVMPDGFRVTPTGEPQVWIANDLTQVPESGFMTPILRVRADTDLRALQKEVEALGLNAAKSFGEDVEDFAMRVETLRDAYFGGTEASFLLLLGAVSLVLLIACVNVANLLLARGTERRRELTIRATLGARRGRLVQQLLAESLLLSLAGGAVGVLLAVWGNQLVSILAPAEFAAVVQTIGINPRVLLFTTAVSILVAPCVGLLPALRASRLDLNETLKEQSRGFAGSRRSWGRSALLVSEISLSMILLVGAGWMMSGYLEERYGDPGFDSEGLLTAGVYLEGSDYFEKLEGNMGRVSPESTLYFERLLEEIRAMSGVEGAGTISHLPSDITGPWRVRPFTRPGREDLTPLPSAFYSEVDAGALQAIGIPLLQGRHISHHDTRDATWVAVINRILAERYFPGENPIGQNIHVQVRAVASGMSIPEERPREIVGVVGDVKYPSIFDPSQAAMYVPQAQHEWLYPGGTYITHIDKKLVIRSTFDDPMRLARQVREAGATIDPEQVVESVMTMDSRLDELETVKTSRFAGQLFGLFGLLALVLAMSGAYGVMSYFVAQREREFGIRMALGADRSDVIGHVFNRLLKPASVGIMVGALGGFLFTKGLSNQFVVGEGSADLFVLTATSLVMILVAVAAGFFPALRATRSTHRLTTADE